MSTSISSIKMEKRFSIAKELHDIYVKVRKALASSQKYPSSKFVHVDEFTFGGKEEVKQAKSYDTKKKKVMITLELSFDNKVK